LAPISSVFSNNKQYNLKIDRNFSTKHKVAVSYSAQRDDSADNVAQYPGSDINGAVIRRPHLVTVNMISTLSQSMINEARFGMNRTSNYDVYAWFHPNAEIRKKAEDFLLQGGASLQNSAYSYLTVVNNGVGNVLNSNGYKDDDKAKAAEKKADAEMLAFFSAGVAALKANNYEEAIKQFKAAAEKDSSQPAVFQNLGLALANVKKYDESAAAYRKAIELKPDDAGFYAELSSALADAGKLDEAAAPLQEAAKRNPSVGAQGYYNLVPWLSGLGIVLTNRGKAKEAVDAFNKAIALDANYAKPYYQLGIAYFGSANTIPQAVSALEKFLQLNPAGPDAETAKQLIEAAKAQLRR
jgi:tetratricopeptide (TPR) repeat protein